MRIEEFNREMEENINVNTMFSIDDIIDEKRLNSFFSPDEDEIPPPSPQGGLEISYGPTIITEEKQVKEIENILIENMDEPAMALHLVSVKKPRTGVEDTK